MTELQITEHDVWEGLDFLIDQLGMTLAFSRQFALEDDQPPMLDNESVEHMTQVALRVSDELRKHSHNLRAMNAVSTAHGTLLILQLLGLLEIKAPASSFIYDKGVLVTALSSVSSRYRDRMLSRLLEGPGEPLC